MDSPSGSAASGVWPWRGGVVIAALVVLAGFIWTRYAGPTPLSWYPRCVLRELTGLYCPGCGTARALHALAHGEFLRALNLNVMTVAFVGFVLFWGPLVFWRGLTRNQPPPPMPLGLPKKILIAVVVFTVLRNLPWWPFVLLAP